MSFFNLKSFRQRRNLTQEELANMIGVKRYTIADWEQGRTQPDLLSLKKLANVFMIPIDYLLDNKSIDYQYDLSNNLSTIRKKEGINKYDMAKLLDLPYDLYNQYEENNYRLPDNLIVKICEIFHVSADYLLGIDDNSNQSQLPDFAYALYGEVEDLTPEQQEEILRLVKTHKEFLKK